MTVTTRNEIELNGKKYKTLSDAKTLDDVWSGWIDPFPESINIGDADYSNRRDLSSWIITAPLYIGVEEWRKGDDNFCYFTDCITSFAKHIFPPRLATALTAPVASNVPTITNADCELETGFDYTATGVSRSSTYKHAGTYSIQVVGAAGARQTGQYLKGWTPGVQYSFKMWVQVPSGTTPTSYRVGIDDGVTTTWANTASAGDQQVTVQKTLSTSALYCRVLVGSGTSADGEGYFDTATITMDSAAGAITYGTPSLAANFNGGLYWMFGNVLAQLNSARTAFETVYQFGSAVTALIASINTRLYIYMGDSTNYYYMPTNYDVAGITQSNSANANWAFKYDAKLFKVNTSGTVAYSSNPDNATPTWTSGGAINDIADQIEGFVVGRDAAGVYVPYAATNSIIMVYDKSVPSWVPTEAQLPNHPIGGKGHAYWNGKLYFSYGLAVKQYYPETGSFIDVGLTVRDGLPAEYNGEITKLYGETGGVMFAAVDASITSGNSKSTLLSYDGFGWQCWWKDTSNDGAMTDIIVSSAASGYAVCWGCGGTVRYIDIPRGIQNPDKITMSYAAAGILLSPWFDAGNPGAAKLAKILADFAKGVTTTETVALKYRLDHTYTDLDTGWTTMDTLNTTAETGYNEEAFASGAGVSKKAIQFRLDFVTAGSTAKADIQALILNFKKRTGAEKIRIWKVIVLCDDYDPGNDDTNATAKQKAANLQAAVTSVVDVTFLYRPNDKSDESYYVTVNCPELKEHSGEDYASQYVLTLIES